MQPSPIPLIILAGSDRRATTLPPDGRRLHPLRGYKGLAIRVGGRPLVEQVARRFRASSEFEPIYLAGPANAYSGLEVSVSRIDTDGTFGENIRTSMEHVRARHPGKSIAFATCDILPEPGQLKHVLETYADCAPCDFFFPMIRAPRERLGTSAWKPAYRVAPGEGLPPERVLPGHLIIVDPEALRLDFVYSLFEIGYRTRNRPIDQRRSAMLRELIGQLLFQDVRHVIALRLPSLTYSVLSAGIGASRELARGTITRGRIEDSFRRLVVKRAHRRRHPERRVQTPIVEALSLAMDVDTEEEARELGGELTDLPA